MCGSEYGFGFCTKTAYFEINLCKLVEGEEDVYTCTIYYDYDDIPSMTKTSTTDNEYYFHIETSTMETGDWYKFSYVSYIDGYFSDPDRRYLEEVRNVGQFKFMGSVCDHFTVCYNEVDSVCGGAYEGSTDEGVPDTIHYLTDDNS